MENEHNWRIGILGIYHESNTFIDQRTAIEDFNEGHLFFGERIIEEYFQAHHEIGGMIEALREYPVEIIPLMYAEATPGGIISSEAGDRLISLMKDELRTVDAFDAFLVAPHGAAVSEDHDDFDGFWLTQLRAMYPEIPIVGTLDPHANASQQMVSVTDALIAYRTNPHLDQREVGAEAAYLLIDILKDKVKPLQTLLSSKVTISIEQQYTAHSPCLELYRKARELSQAEGLLSISVLLGFPYADVHDMGTSFLVVTNDDVELAESTLNQLELHMLQNQKQFSADKTSIEEALQKMQLLAKPVLFLDMGDNVGGGSPGDSTFLLHALEATSQCKSFICIKDPEAVQKLNVHQAGARVKLSIGGKSDQQHGLPLTVEVQLISVFDGVFEESEPRHGGQVHFNMGKTAVVKTSNDTMIMLTTLRTVPFSLQQLLHFDIRPEDFDVIVAKGVQAPIAAYASVCPSIIRVNTKGVTTADLRQLEYKKRRKPLFPFEVIDITKNV